MQVAAVHRDTLERDVIFIPVASIAAPEFIVAAIAEALGLAFYGPLEPKTLLFNYLHEKALLLVLDN